MTFPVCFKPRRFCVPSADRHFGAAAAVARALSALLFALAPALAIAITPFVVKDIRVEGVQRTEAGTVFSYLPIKVGDRVDDEKASAAVKALYATGFFRDVRLEFDKDTLKKALKDIGIAESRIFDRSALERAEQEFKRQYINRGYYAVKVTT